MNRNNGREAKIFKGETRISLKIDLEKLPLLPTRISLQNQTLHMGITIRSKETLMINAKINHSTETMEMDLETDLSTIRMGTGDTMENFLIPHRFKGKTVRKTVQSGKQEVISPTILLSADLTLDLRLVSRPMNENFRKTITR